MSTKTTFVAEATKAVAEQRDVLARARRITKAEALEVMARTFRDNLEASAGTDQDSYWRICLEITDRMAADERGFTDAGVREIAP